MADDIVTRLREEVAKAEVSNVLPNWEMAKCMWGAAEEIERLRKLAYLLIDELRHDGGYEAYTPKMLFDEFYEQAVRGD